MTEAWFYIMSVLTCVDKSGQIASSEISSSIYPTLRIPSGSPARVVDIVSAHSPQCAPSKPNVLLTPAEGGALACIATIAEQTQLTLFDTGETPPSPLP